MFYAQYRVKFKDIVDDYAVGCGRHEIAVGRIAAYDVERISFRAEIVTAGGAATRVKFFAREPFARRYGQISGGRNAFVRFFVLAAHGAFPSAGIVYDANAARVFGETDDTPAVTDFQNIVIYRGRARTGDE